MKPQIEPRFLVEAYFDQWLIFDSQTKIVVPETVGDLESRLLVAEILNLRWSKECQNKNKVIPIR